MKIADPIRYIGLWSPGGHSRADWQDDAEAFESVEHAKQVLLGRFYNQSHWYKQPLKVEWGLDGSVRDLIEVNKLDTPGVSEGASIILLPIDWSDPVTGLLGRAHSGDYSHLLEVGPRGGLKVTRA